MTQTPPPGVKSLRVNDYDLAYAEQGRGTAVVFVHGSAGDYRYFETQLEFFATRYRAIAVSLRHSYPERWDGKGAYSMAQQVADLAQFLKQLDVGPVHLIGHSRGGTVALYTASRVPQLIRTLTLSEAGRGMPAFTSDIAAGLEQRRDNYRKVSACFDRGDIDEGLEIFVDFINGPGAWKRTPERVQQWLRDNAWTLIGDQNDRWPDFSCAEAGRIDVPVLLLGAEKSPALFAAILDNLESCLPNVERRLIPNSSHSMPRMNATEFNRVTMEFISKSE